MQLNQQPIPLIKVFGGDFQHLIFEHQRGELPDLPAIAGLPARYCKQLHRQVSRVGLLAEKLAEQLRDAIHVGEFTGDDTE